MRLDECRVDVHATIAVAQRARMISRQQPHRRPIRVQQMAALFVPFSVDLVAGHVDGFSVKLFGVRNPLRLPGRLGAGFYLLQKFLSFLLDIGQRCVEKIAVHAGQLVFGFRAMW